VDKGATSIADIIAVVLQICQPHVGGLDIGGRWGNLLSYLGCPILYFFKILTSHSLLYCRLPLLLSHLNIFFFFKIPNSKVRCISHCDFFFIFH